MKSNDKPATGADAAEFVCPNRRSVLAALGGAGLVTVLAACGTDEEPTGTTGNGAPTGAPDDGTGTGAAALAATADIPVGGGKVVDGVLIVQPAENQFAAYTAACPHQGVVVSAPQGGVITCPAHGSKFSDADGSLINGPATKGLTPVAVKVEGTNIVKG